MVGLSLCGRLNLLWLHDDDPAASAFAFCAHASRRAVPRCEAEPKGDL